MLVFYNRKLLKMRIPNVRSGHIGRKIQRVREIKNIKQEVLANKLGVTQQAVSLMEQSEVIDEEKLQRVAEALGVNVEEIKNFTDEAVFNNYLKDNATVFNYIEDYVQNPVEKIVELYERLLKEKDEIIELLKRQQKAV
jgi:transcriptional regulator with XRE-family HTH domain